MITIADRVKQWVLEHPTHASFMADGLINSSALARTIRRDLEKQAGERLSIEAITLALNRLKQSLERHKSVNFNEYIGEVSVQSGLSVLTIPQVNLKIDDFFDAVKQLQKNQEYTLLTRGVWHTAIIGKQSVVEDLSKNFKNTVLVHDQVAVTIKLKPGHLPVPGVCGYILEKLAYRNVNLTEVTSSHDELTVIVDERFTQPTLACLI